MPSARPRFSDFDRQCMARALSLAERGLGYVEPNPLVGCVIVRGTRVLAEGCHRRFGGPHAEVDALTRCRSKPTGATAYVTLEPCSHQGKTPPCANALIDARIARVVIPTSDPFPAVAGRGVRRLRAAGVRVDVGLCRDEARRVNAPFFKRVLSARPYVILKWAQSLDGKIATRTGDSKWITSAPARREAHRLRARVDGILVGVETVLADDPMLTCRHVRPRRTAVRVVLDSRLRTPPAAKLVTTAATVPTWIVTTRAGLHRHARRARRLERAGCTLLGVAATRAGRVDPGALLTVLGERSWTNLLVEGGGRVLGAFFDAGLADEAHVFVAPRLIGGSDAPGPLGGQGPAELTVPDSARLVDARAVGVDRLYRFALRA